MSSTRFIWERLEGGADGFVAAQRYKAGVPEERIIVAVGDVGVGIRESLRPRYGAS